MTPAEFRKLLVSACYAGRAALNHDLGAEEECERRIREIKDALRFHSPAMEPLASAALVAAVREAVAIGRRTMRATNQARIAKCDRLIRKVEKLLGPFVGERYSPATYGVARGGRPEKTQSPFEFDPQEFTAQVYAPLVAPYEVDPT